MVLQDGAVVCETDRNGGRPGTRFLTHPVARSPTSALIGFALQDGLIDSLDNKALKYRPEM